MLQCALVTVSQNEQPRLLWILKRKVKYTYTYPQPSARLMCFRVMRILVPVRRNDQCIFSTASKELHGFRGHFCESHYRNAAIPILQLQENWTAKGLRGWCDDSKSVFWTGIKRAAIWDQVFTRSEVSLPVPVYLKNSDGLTLDSQASCQIRRCLSLLSHYIFSPRADAGVAQRCQVDMKCIMGSNTLSRHACSMINMEKKSPALLLL